MASKQCPADDFTDADAGHGRVETRRAGIYRDASYISRFRAGEGYALSKHYKESHFFSISYHFMMFRATHCPSFSSDVISHGSHFHNTSQMHLPCRGQNSRLTAHQSLCRMGAYEYTFVCLDGVGGIGVDDDGGGGSRAPRFAGGCFRACARAFFRPCQGADG